MIAAPRPRYHVPMAPTSPTMHCIDCGYPLEGLVSRHCPECGQPFDPDDAATFQRMMPEAREVFHASNLLHAAVVRAMLEGEGIPTMVMPGGSLGLGTDTLPSLHVGLGDVERARDLLAAHAKRTSKQDSMAELEDSGDATHRADWQCDACGETVDGHFETCWNCAAEQDDRDEAGELR